MKRVTKEQSMKSATSLIALAAVLLAWTGKLNAADPTLPPNTLTDAEKEAGWVLLSDGRTLAGRKANENPESFSVRDGLIVAQARGTAARRTAGSRPTPRATSSSSVRKDAPCSRISSSKRM